MEINFKPAFIFEKACIISITPKDAPNLRENQLNTYIYNVISNVQLKTLSGLLVKLKAG